MARLKRYPFVGLSFSSAIDRFLPWLATLMALNGLHCAPSHAGRTVGRKVLQIEGGLGGPLIKNLGVAIPAPNLPIGVRYGATDRLDVAGHVNVTPLFTGGFLAFDARLTWGLITHEGRRGPNLATSAGFVFLSDFRDSARFNPLFDIAGGYTVRWFTAFVGADVLLDFWGGYVHVDPYVGVEFDVRRFTLSAAFVWFHPAGDAFASTFQFVSPGDHGGLGLILGLKGRFDLNDRSRRGRDVRE